MKVFIFTTGLNSWNAQIINSILADEELTVRGIFQSKSQGGDKGQVTKVKRLFGYGVDNLIKIYLQKKFKKDDNVVSSIKEYQDRIKGIPLYHTDSFRQCLKEAETSADLSILVYFNRIIPKKYVSNLNMINIHPSKLPEYRGVQPIFWALLNDEKEIGVTIHKVDEGIDTGPIYDQITFSVTSHSINDNMNLASKKVAERLPGLLKGILKNETEPEIQDKDEGSYFSRPTSSDIRLFFKRRKRYY